MKIIFPKPGEHLVCQRCRTPINDSDNQVSEDGAIEDYWCNSCIDFVGVKIVKDKLPSS